VAGIGPQHLDRVIEWAEQMGADRQHGATLALAEHDLIRLQHRWAAQWHHHALAALQASERAIVHPLHLGPERVDVAGQGWGGGGADPDLHLHPRGFASFDDVSGPVPIGSGVLIGVMGGDPGLGLQITEVLLTEQHRLDRELGHHHLHAGMGVVNLKPAADQEVLIDRLDLPVEGSEAERRGGAKTMPCLEPGHRQPEDQKNQHQCGHAPAVIRPNVQPRSVSAFAGPIRPLTVSGSGSRCSAH
jgi:hypothetical protein